MIARLVLVLLALVTIERAASACCLGCPCTKYKQPDPGPPLVIQDPAFGYMHSVRGNVPSWNMARIAKFLTSGLWKPLPPPKPRKGDIAAQPALEPSSREVRHVAPLTIRFISADKAGEPTQVAAEPVLVRRIEKHGKAILVEVNDQVFRLAPCPQKRGYACLLDPAGLTLQPVPAPGNDPFAQPPPDDKPPR